MANTDCGWIVVYTEVSQKRAWRRYIGDLLEADFWTGTSSGLHRDLTETGAYDAHGRRNSQVRISGQWTTPHWEAKAEMPRRYIAPRF